MLVGVTVLVGLLVGVLVGVFVGVTVFVGVFVGVTVLVGVLVGVFVGVTEFVGVLVGVLVGVTVDAGVLVGVNVGVTVFVGVFVGVLVGVLVGVTVASGVLVGVLILWMRGPREAGELGGSSAEDLGFRTNRAFYSVLLLYGLPMLIAYVYSVYRAPVFQDSVLLFSFPFGLLSAFWWVDSVGLHVRWKARLLLLTLGLNVYTLLVDRNHTTLFGNQSYDGAVRTFQRWGLEKTVGKLGSMRGEAAMWVYGFEPFFMEFHSQALGWDLVGLQRRGLQVQYLREETDDYGLFRDRLKALKCDDFYYVNMVGMDPMLRVWIQERIS